MSINVEELVSQHTEAAYPNVRVLKPNDTLPVVVRALEPGDIQLIVEFNGKRKAVANISPSAINIQCLLRCVGSLEYSLSKGVSTTIDNIEEYLNCLR